MHGARIIVSADPDPRRFLECVIVGTPVPGTVVTLVPGVAYQQGRFSFQAATMTADGDPRMIAVLVEDNYQGFIGGNVVTGVAPAAVVAGTRQFLYVPIPGEELNMLVAGQPGTGSTNAFTIGERLIVQHNTGKLIVEATSSVSSPFMCLEHIDEVADVDTLVWCQRT